MADFRPAGASPDASYVTISSETTLSSERTITAGSGITITDGGAGSTITIADKGVAKGRMKFGVTTTYQMLPGVLITGAGATGAPGANADSFYPFVVTGRALAMDRLAVEVTATGTGNIRLGLTALDTDWNPTGAPLCDSGDISTASTGVKEFVFSSPITLQPGRYAAVFNKSSTASMRYYLGGLPNWALSTAMGSAPFYYYGMKSRTYGAFPNPMTIDTPSATWSGVLSNVGYYIVCGISTPDAG